MKSIICSITLLVITGCSSMGSPIDILIPVRLPQGVTNQVDRSVFNVFGFTNLSTLKQINREITFNAKAYRAKYQLVAEDLNWYIDRGDSTSDSVLALLGTLGLGSAPLTFMAGSKRKRAGDIDPLEHKVAVNQAGMEDPANFTKV